MAAEEQRYAAEYSRNKFSKNPKWIDGIVKRCGNKVTLHDGAQKNGPPLDTNLRHTGELTPDERYDDIFERYSIRLGDRIEQGGGNSQEFSSTQLGSTARAAPTLPPPGPPHAPMRARGVGLQRRKPPAASPAGTSAAAARAPAPVAQAVERRAPAVLERSFVVQYTKQKTQKTKKWIDGALQLRARGAAAPQATLKDERGKVVEVFFVDAGAEVEVDEQIESEQFLIRIDSEDGVPERPQPPAVTLAPRVKQEFRPPGILKRREPEGQADAAPTPKQTRVSFEVQGEERDEEEEEEEEQESVREAREQRRRAQEAVLSGDPGFSGWAQRAQQPRQPAPAPAASAGAPGWGRAGPPRPRQAGPSARLEVRGPAPRAAGGSRRSRARSPWAGMGSFKPPQPAAAAPWGARAPPPGAPSAPSGFPASSSSSAGASAPKPAAPFRLGLRFPTRDECRRRASSPDSGKDNEKEKPLSDTYPSIDGYRKALFDATQREIEAQLREARPARPSRRHCALTRDRRPQAAEKFWAGYEQAEQEAQRGPQQGLHRLLPNAEAIRDACYKKGGIRYYPSCRLLCPPPPPPLALRPARRHRSHRPPWAHERSPQFAGGTHVSGAILLISNEHIGPASEYMKEDLWVISTRPSLELLAAGPGRAPANTKQSFTIFARSSMNGGPREGKVEVSMVGEWPDFTRNDLARGVTVYAFRALSGCHELALADNLAESVLPSSLPVLPALVNPAGAPDLPPLDDAFLKVPPLEIARMASGVAAEFGLNADQRRVLRLVSEWIAPASPEAERVWGDEGRDEDGRDCRDGRAGPALLVHGVFGAGKSHLLAAVCIFLARASEAAMKRARRSVPPLRVLVASNTNVAVDNVLMNLDRMGYKDFMRVGSVRKIARPVLPFTTVGGDERSIKESIRELELELKGAASEADRAILQGQLAEAKDGRLKSRSERLNKAPVVGVTCHSCLNSVFGKETKDKDKDKDGGQEKEKEKRSSRMFDVVILDECSQITEPASLLPMARFHARRLLLVGDPKQLPPQLVSVRDEASKEDAPPGLAKTMFVRLSRAGLRPVLLATQYRCHPAFSALSSRLFYGGRLRDGVTPADRPPLAPGVPPLLAFDSQVTQEERRGGSFVNRAEADAVLHAVGLLERAGVRPSQVGVVCLYKAQAALITERLGGPGAAGGYGGGGRPSGGRATAQEVPQISTVDAFQGAEKDVIIVACTRTSKGTDFMCCPRRVNVTITRARRHLIVLGSYPVLSELPYWREILRDARECQGGYRRLEDLMGPGLVPAHSSASAGGGPSAPLAPPPAPPAPAPAPPEARGPTLAPWARRPVQPPALSSNGGAPSAPRAPEWHNQGLGKAEAEPEAETEAQAEAEYEPEAGPASEEAGRGEGDDPDGGTGLDDEELEAIAAAEMERRKRAREEEEEQEEGEGEEGGEEDAAAKGEEKWEGDWDRGAGGDEEETAAEGAAEPANHEETPSSHGGAPASEFEEARPAPAPFKLWAPGAGGLRPPAPAAAPRPLPDIPFAPGTFQAPPAAPPSAPAPAAAGAAGAWGDDDADFALDDSF
eukprot:tig00021318_g20187.t1